MTCVTSQKGALIPNVTPKVIGDVTYIYIYIWTGTDCEAKPSSLQLSKGVSGTAVDVEWSELLIIVKTRGAFAR